MGAKKKTLSIQFRESLPLRLRGRTPDANRGTAGSSPSEVGSLLLSSSSSAGRTLALGARGRRVRTDLLDHGHMALLRFYYCFVNSYRSRKPLPDN